jgi:hypothetical protein
MSFGAKAEIARLKAKLVVERAKLKAALSIVERASILWAKSVENYERNAPHNTGSKAACVAARDALQAAAYEISKLTDNRED